MRENTGARIVFPTQSDEDKELITIIGKKEGVEAAKQELMKSIKDLVWKGIYLSSQIRKRKYSAGHLVFLVYPAGGSFFSARF